MSTNSTEHLSRVTERVGAERSLLNAANASCKKATDCISDHPRAAVLIGLGVGLGVGIAAGMYLGQAKQPTPRGWFDRRTAEELGKHVLNAFARVVPDSLHDRSST